MTTTREGTLLCLQELASAAEPTREMRLRRGGIFAEEPLRGLARGVEEIQVGGEVSETQHRHAALTRAEELTGPAHAQIVPRDLEPVVVFVDHPEAFARRRRQRILV